MGHGAKGNDAHTSFGTVIPQQMHAHTAFWETLIQ